MTIQEKMREGIAEFLWTRGDSQSRFFPFSALVEIEKKSPFWKGTRQAYLAKADQLLKIVGVLGYRKLPKDKPPLLSDGEVAEIVGSCKEWFEIPNKIAQAQRDADTKHYEEVKE